MKERPILFSAPMVRAILAGTKTQTRRVVKPQPESGHDGEPYWHVGGYRAWQFRGIADPLRMGTNNPLVCPYGQPGDRLWVRECWARDDEDASLMYRADVGLGGDADEWERGRLDGVPRYRWRPSIHMPRWASRITLEVTGVRVDRLQDIMERDVFAEGIEKLEVHANTGRNGGAVPTGRFKGLDNWSDSEPYWVNPVDAFAGLWESINGAGSWDANPWVWVVEFKMLRSNA